MMDNIFGLADIINYIWIIPFMFSIHEIEEWNILKWYKKYYKNLPESTNTSIRIHIITFCVLSCLLTLLANILNGTFLFSLIVIFLSSFILLNFLQHIIWTIQLRTYSPGLLTAILCILSVVFVNVQLIQGNLIILPFYIIVLFIIPSLIGTMKVNGEMTKELKSIHCLFIKVEKLLNSILKRA